jgi:hypothetical protein
VPINNCLWVTIIPSAEQVTDLTSCEWTKSVVDIIDGLFFKPFLGVFVSNVQHEEDNLTFVWTPPNVIIDPLVLALITDAKKNTELDKHHYRGHCKREPSDIVYNIGSSNCQIYPTTRKLKATTVTCIIALSSEQHLIRDVWIHKIGE